MLGGLRGGEGDPRLSDVAMHPVVNFIINVPDNEAKTFN